MAPNSYTVHEEQTHAERWIKDQDAAFMSQNDLQAFWNMCGEGDAYPLIDGCEVVEPDGECEHGYRAPLLVLGLL